MFSKSDKIFSQENFLSLRVLLIIKNKELDQHVFFKGRIASALVDSAALCSVSTGVLDFEFER